MSAIPARRTARNLAAMVGVVCAVAIIAGCRRGFHYRSADAQAYCLVNAKGQAPTWQVEPDFRVQPDTRSRFYDPTCKTDPRLPVAAPRLYEYQFPELATPNAPTRNLAARDVSGGSNPPPSAQEAQQIGGQQFETQDAPEEIQRPVSSTRRSSPFQVVSHRTATVTPDNEDINSLRSSVLVALIRQPPSETDLSQLPISSSEEREEAFTLTINPIPAEVWESLPASCVQRMLEFDTVRGEYWLTYEKTVTEEQLDPSRRLTLENILELALINNRDYQTRKETLYRTALRLSLEQFQYDLRPFNFGNGTDVGYVHNRIGGTEVNTLSTPTRLGFTKSLYTAGNLVTRFANDVVLTFNGASGYSSRVGSELLLDLSQPLIQRDVTFEPLTQAERDVVYAARDYVRFRKVLFRDLALRYYNLLLTYRSIAIDTQDYFSNQRGFNRASALERVGEIPRFQVDQFEQNALASRGNLVSSCNALEGALDRLKIATGLPTELPINLDLSELESLTLRDEAAVVEEQIRRKIQYVLQQRERQGAQTAVPAAAELMRRMKDLESIRTQLGTGDPGLTVELDFALTRLEVEALRIDVGVKFEELRKALDTEDNKQEALIFGLTREYGGALLASIQGQLELLVKHLQLVENVGRTSANRARDLAMELASLQADYDAIVAENRELEINNDNDALSDQLGRFLQEIDRVVAQLVPLERNTSRELVRAGVNIVQNENGFTLLIEETIAAGGLVLGRQSQGLTPIEVDPDQAMLTALVQRLDLMNVRGDLADRWRDIKYAGDDLRSILDLRATQSVRTPPGSNKPFDFSFDDSTTTLGIQFDTPLNRRAQRNAFRLALINYNAALRNVIQAEDNVKLDIRDDLRSLELDRNQYAISIASAALAYERVVSTRLQLITPGGTNVTARDFLESQQAYTRSLSAVAQRHIGYVVDRIEFFLNLEQLQVDQANFWPNLREEAYPFIPNMDFMGTNPQPYGGLSCGPWYSDCIRRLERSGAGQAYSLKAPETEDAFAQPAEPLNLQPAEGAPEVVSPELVPPLDQGK